ncbi:2-oxoglutarate dehydrogenase, E2 component, dihydrolipoamide succinyltransferase, partial [Verminephrobacter sp. Larva24]
CSTSPPPAWTPAVPTTSAPRAAAKTPAAPAIATRWVSPEPASAVAAESAGPGTASRARRAAKAAATPAPRSKARKA